jgi:tRNA nucleotidyltransferase (CCA-adding enzyme)
MINKIFLLLLVSLVQAVPLTIEGREKIVVNRKTQAVDFDESTVEGQARHPDAAYLVQKRSVDFVPLYKVREHFDENIRASVDYLK